MASISAVTYNVIKKKKLEDGRLIVDATLTFGDGTATYPAGGVPFAPGSLGLRTICDALNIQDTGGSGFVYKPDVTNNKIRIFQGPGSLGPDIELTTSATPAAATIKVQAIGW